MATLNQVQLIGYVGHIEKYGEGQLCIRLSLRTNKFYTELNPNPAPIWHQVVVFNKLAEKLLARMNTHALKKGSLLFIQGRLDYVTIVPNDHANKNAQIVADKIQFLDRQSLLIAKDILDSM